LKIDTHTLLDIVYNICEN